MIRKNSTSSNVCSNQHVDVETTYWCSIIHVSSAITLYKNLTSHIQENFTVGLACKRGNCLSIGGINIQEMWGEDM